MARILRKYANCKRKKLLQFSIKHDFHLSSINWALYRTSSTWAARAGLLVYIKVTYCYVKRNPINYLFSLLIPKNS